MIGTLCMFAAMTVTTADQIEKLAWMAGDWKADISGGQFHETWLTPEGGTMQGTGRLVKDGVCQFMEFMSIEDSGQGVVLYMVLGKPSKEVKKPVPFKLTKHEGRKAVFERADDDFPKRIVYFATPTGMTCRIEDDSRHEDFVFKRR